MLIFGIPANVFGPYAGLNRDLGVRVSESSRVPVFKIWTLGTVWQLLGLMLCEVCEIRC